MGVGSGREGEMVNASEDVAEARQLGWAQDLQIAGERVTSDRCPQCQRRNETIKAKSARYQCATGATGIVRTAETWGLLSVFPVHFCSLGSMWHRVKVR